MRGEELNNVLREMRRKQPAYYNVKGWLFLFVVIIGIAVLVVGLKSKNETYAAICDTDKDFKMDQYDLAEVDCRKAISLAEHSPLNLAFDERSIYEKLAVILCCEGKLEESLPYYQRSLDSHLNLFEERYVHRFNRRNRDSYNEYYEAIEISRVLFNYTRVLMHLDRPQEAKEIFDSTWAKIFKNCRPSRRVQFEKNAIDRLVNFYEDDSSRTTKETLRTDLNRLESESADVQLKDYMDWLRKTYLYKQKHMTFNDGIFDKKS